ncbi:unnamed protein product, partial [Amoebophrya sp. A120]|eukprot:GSA120T00007953001.1
MHLLQSCLIRDAQKRPTAAFLREEVLCLEQVEKSLQSLVEFPFQRADIRPIWGSTATVLHKKHISKSGSLVEDAGLLTGMTMSGEGGDSTSQSNATPEYIKTIPGAAGTTPDENPIDGVEKNYTASAREQWTQVAEALAKLHDDDNLFDAAGKDSFSSVQSPPDVVPGVDAGAGNSHEKEQSELQGMPLLSGGHERRGEDADSTVAKSQTALDRNAEQDDIYHDEEDCYAADGGKSTDQESAGSNPSLWSSFFSSLLTWKALLAFVLVAGTVSAAAGFAVYTVDQERAKMDTQDGQSGGGTTKFLFPPP